MPAAKFEIIRNCKVCGTPFQAASAEMYAQSGTQGGAQQGANAGGQQANQGGKEDIQDADFEEVK